MIVVFALLAIGLGCSPAAGATTRDLSGEWLNSSYTLSAYDLHMSADGKTLTASWGANIGKLQEGLVGGFTGTLDQSGTAFAGPMHVDEGSLRINGTMTVTISSQQEFGYPLLTVSYQQDNGVDGSFTLEIWIQPLTVSSSSSSAVTTVFACPGPQPCHQRADAHALGAGASRTVGSLSFTIDPRHSRTIRLPLNNAGRALLANRRSLRAQVLMVTLNKTLELPPLTQLGTVTFRIK